MNRENAQKLVDLMQLAEFETIISNMDIKYKYAHVIAAYAKGATVQIRSDDPSDDWDDIEAPNFNAEDMEYRVKPVRAVVWFRVYKTPNGIIGVWIEDTLEATISSDCLPYPDCEWVTSPACTEVEKPYRSFK